MRKAVNDPDLFKGLESLNCKACYDKEFDEFVGKFVRPDGSAITGPGSFNNQRSYLDELYHIGRKTVDDTMVVVIKPGMCKDTLCSKTPDIDNLKITFNKDGSVKDIEIIDRKVYKDQKDLKKKYKESTVDRGAKLQITTSRTSRNISMGPTAKRGSKNTSKTRIER